MPGSALQTGTPRGFGVLQALSLALALVGLVGCSDGPVDPAAFGPSRVRLSYQGPLVGSYAAEGELQRGKGMLDHTYAYGLRYQNPTALEVRSVVLDAASDRVDWVDIQIPADRPGTYAIDQDRCPRWEAGCAGLFLVLRLPNQEGKQAKYSCTLLTGTIRVATASGRRVQGTFSGAGECIDRDAPEGTDHPPVTVTGGEFDVELSSGVRADAAAQT